MSEVVLTLRQAPPQRLDVSALSLPALAALDATRIAALPLRLGNASVAAGELFQANICLRLEATFQDSRHAEWALWQLGTNAEALAPQWLRTSLRNRAAALATCYGDSP